MSIFQGKITRIDSDGQVWAEISDLAIDQEFPCRWVNTNIIPGDFVLVVSIDGAQEDLVVIGKMNGDI